MLHNLPNGDVRVIQSPADNVMMRTPSEENVTHTAGNHRPSALSALKFEGSVRDLQKIIGAHFHIGELIADADIDSQIRRRSTFYFDAHIRECWQGAMQKIALFCEPPSKTPAVQTEKPLQKPLAKPRSKTTLASC